MSTSEALDTACDPAKFSNVHQKLVVCCFWKLSQFCEELLDSLCHLFISNIQVLLAQRF